MAKALKSYTYRDGLCGSRLVLIGLPYQGSYLSQTGRAGIPLVDFSGGYNLMTYSAKCKLALAVAASVIEATTIL